MYDYQKKTHEDFTRGQAVTLMADGHPIGPEMIVIGSHGEEFCQVSGKHIPASISCTWHSKDGVAQSCGYPPNALCPLDELEYYKDPDDQIELLKLQIDEARDLLGPGGDCTLKGRVESVLAELDTAKKTLASLRIIFSQDDLSSGTLVSRKLMLGRIRELLGI